MNAWRNTLLRRVRVRRMARAARLAAQQSAVCSVRTPDQFRAWLLINGITLKQFCREHGITRMSASDLLRGRCQGRYGEVHRAAVAMGLKPNPKEAV